MRNKHFVIVLAIILSVAAWTNSYAIEDSEDTMNIESVTIMAASSLTVPVTEIAKVYSSQAVIDINTVYENSSELLHKIKDGDPADIIITPSKKYIDEMQQEGLIDGNSVKIIAANSLDIVAAKEMTVEKQADVKDTLTKLHNKTLLVMGDPTTTALGDTTREVLQKLKLWQDYDRFMVRAPTASKTIDLIIKGQSAGIVYATDAILYKDKINNLGHIPTSLHTPINYYAAVVVSDNMQRARAALKFLSSSDAKQIFQNNGFVVK